MLQKQKISAKITKMVLKRPLLFSILAGFLSTLMLQAHFKQKESELLKSVELSPVLAAAVDISAGIAINKFHLIRTKVPSRFSAAGTMRSFDDAKGYVTAVDIPKGTPILKSMLVPLGAKSGISMLIPQGMRAISISVDLANGVSGLIRPGDKVNVVTTIDVGEGQGGWKKTFSIVNDAFVIAVDQHVLGRPKLKNDTGRNNGLFTKLPAGLNSKGKKSVTLAVTPLQAQEITFSNHAAKLSLILLPRNEEEKNDLDVTTVDNLGEGGLIQRRKAFKEYRGK